MHDILFEKVSEWGSQEDSTALFQGYADALELDADDFTACLESGETNAQIQADMERGQAAGVSGAPAFFVNDWFVSGAQPFEVFQETIEKALQGEHPPPTPTPLPDGATIFDANPEQPGYTYGGDPFCGSEEAEIALIEFADFQSTENLNHYLKDWAELEEAYLETGELRLVVKHFPNIEHVQAFTAAEAAECAAQQGAFCAMYDMLFEKQDEWSELEDVTAVFKEYADELDLDAETFATCLDEGQTSEKVMQDFSIGQQNNFPAAPVFFIIKGEQGGNVPADQIQEAIEQLKTQ